VVSTQRRNVDLAVARAILTSNSSTSIWSRPCIGCIVNLLDTQIALVEAEEGIAIIPSFGLPACRNRKVVVSQLTNPVARFDFHLISNRGMELPPGAEEPDADYSTDSEVC
jgi:DNA-binding transcriptional LysR family regulator